MCFRVIGVRAMKGVNNTFIWRRGGMRRHSSIAGRGILAYSDSTELFDFRPKIFSNSNIRRNNRDFGANSGENGHRFPPLGISRDTVRETERGIPRSQLVARTGVSTKKADVVSVGFVS